MSARTGRAEASATGHAEEAPPVERELKFPCPDLSSLRERLNSLQAERVAPSGLEDNLVLDRDGELAASGCLLRLRNDRSGSRVTFKGPARMEDDVRLREEHEVQTEDAEAMREILERLGFAVTTRYQKQREEWRLGGVVVALDRTPIGDYAEFEGDGARKVAERCGFEPAKAERRSYIEIYSDYREDHPDAPPDMVFP